VLPALNVTHINHHLIRDSSDNANQKDLPLAVISLDHASAYDSAEHLYIYHVLQTFALGMTFIRNIGTAYRNTQRLVKIRNTAQGLCSHSQLNPFLLMCNIILRAYGLPEQELFAAHMRKTSQFSTSKKVSQMLQTFTAYGARQLDFSYADGAAKWTTR
jgi:hypothetical protein